MAWCADPTSKFFCDLTNTIVDKGIIGAALAFVGWYISKAIERFKSEQSLRAVVAQKELDNVADVWEKMATWESNIDAAIEDYQKTRSTTPRANLAAIQADLGKRIVALKAEGDEVRVLARKTRFWTGEQLYSFFDNYAEQLTSELESIVPSKDETLTQVQQHLTGNRLEATRVLEGLLDRSRRASTSGNRDEAETTPSVERVASPEKQATDST